jgi:integrase
VQALTLFVQSIRSPYTQKLYLYHLAKYCKAVSLDYDGLLSLEKPAAEALAINYLLTMKQKGLSYSTRNSAMSAIKHLYLINDKELNGKKLARFLGENTKTVKDRAYTHEEIKRILDKCDERKRVLVLILASTGMRIGGLSGMKLKHVTKLEQEGIYRFIVYENTKQEYVTYCTPECAQAIDSYLAYRKRYGEQLKPEHPLIRDQFDKDGPLVDKEGNPINAALPRTLKYRSLQNIIFDILQDAGLRGKNIKGEERKRKELMANHAFRKFFRQQCRRAGVDVMQIEYLMGHKVGDPEAGVTKLMMSYDPSEEEELLREYFKAAEFLTISDENRTKRRLSEVEQKNKELTERNERLERLEAKVALLESGKV